MKGAARRGRRGYPPLAPGAAVKALRGKLFSRKDDFRKAVALLRSG